MNVDSLEQGIVIDHIQAGKSMEIYKIMQLGKLDRSVGIIKNAKSKKSGKKDIIKIEHTTDVDFDVLGFIDPNITVNIIRDGKIAEKKHMHMPQQVVNVVQCKNPRCITSVEQELPHVFKLVDGDKYRCIYCEEEYRPGKSKKGRHF